MTLTRIDFDQIAKLKEQAMIPGANSMLFDNFTPSHAELMSSGCPILTAINAAFSPTTHTFSILARVALLEASTISTRLTETTRFQLNNFLLQGSQPPHHPRPQQSLQELIDELDVIATNAVIRAIRQHALLSPAPPLPPDPFDLLLSVEPLPVSPPITSSSQRCSTRCLHSPVDDGKRLLPPPACTSRRL
jgi:hypothetical protein